MKLYQVKIQTSLNYPPTTAFDFIVEKKWYTDKAKAVNHVVKIKKSGKKILTHKITPHELKLTKQGVLTFLNDLNNVN